MLKHLGKFLFIPVMMPGRTSSVAAICGYPVGLNMNYHGIMESLIWVGRDFEARLVPTSAVDEDTFHYPRLLQALSNLAFIPFKLKVER